MVSSQLTIQQAVELARQHHEAGQLREAEMLYREVLAAQPDQPDATQLLGVLAFQAGNADVALQLLHRAAEINPCAGSTHANLARVLSAVGRRDEAVTEYRKSISLEPSNPETHNNLANLLHMLGVLEEAVNEYRQAIALKHDFAEAYNNLGNALRTQGKIDASIAALRCALKIRPKLADAHYNLGLSLKAAGDSDAAEKEFRAALDCRPSYPEAWNNLGSVLQERSESDKAMEAFRHALALRPNFPEALVNLGNALRSTGQIDQSIAMIQQALKLKPNYACGFNSLASSFHSAGRFDDAVSHYRQAISLRPDWHIPHFNLGFTLLLQGDFKNGWHEHEYRRQAKNLDGKQQCNLPMWDGSELAGKRILLHTEQGFGDAIQFCRYAPLVAGRGGRVVLRCQKELVCLLKSLAGIETVLSEEDPIPHDIDLHCPLMSLPMIFKTSAETVPSQTPYLFANPECTTAWKDQLEKLPPSIKVGLVWAGRATYMNDRNRSLSLDMLAPLANMPGVGLISLQKGPGADQIRSVSFEVNDFGARLDSFADTAALISQLDLVITCDTAVAHLAGAMGKQTWVLLPAVPDWRWMLDRSDSPWYPSVQLFRQPVHGDWQSPINQIAQALRSFTATA